MQYIRWSLVLSTLLLLLRQGLTHARAPARIGFVLANCSLSSDLFNIAMLVGMHLFGAWLHGVHNTTARQTFALASALT